MQHAAAGGERHHGQGVGHRLGGERGALQRVERDIDAGAFAGADLFADVEHGGLVPLALADHDDSPSISI